ncbi:uncharacterized protein BJ212DRAFT_1296245 [Suillus subaureus]|uniref:Uncharacterized protein n=1 Tax=Suillus subaureus TaxID=48587 RepID=A0A9P7EK75_9AGAM|nr:uncharacterized protein BJ212DRAFT_1296245 [Suillus subaureus]KAG1823669.1 hypothetical protein BJ212DRAFT_1296245 [Suillus subaureus]
MTATSSFFSKVLDVLNISLRFSLRYFKLQLIAWQQYVQGSIFTLPAARMLCALGSDSKLKDASAIDWYNDPDDDTPMVPTPLPSASNGKLTSFRKSVKLSTQLQHLLKTSLHPKDEDEVNKEEAYQKTKAFGDKDHKDRKHTKKEEHSGDLKVVFTQEKGCINLHTQECEE